MISLCSQKPQIRFLEEIVFVNIVGKKPQIRFLEEIVFVKIMSLPPLLLLNQVSFQPLQYGLDSFYRL